VFQILDGLTEIIIVYKNDSDFIITNCFYGSTNINRKENKKQKREGVKNRYCGKF